MPTGKANFIEVTSDTENCYTCSFKGLDVFNIKVEKLVEEIHKISPYDRDHWELRGLYIFPQIGMRLWRPIIRKEEDFEQEWFRICLLAAGSIWRATLK